MDTLMRTEQIRPKELEVGDYVSYNYNSKSNNKSGRGIIRQITNSCIFIHPNHASYKSQVISIAFLEIYIKEVSVSRIISGQDIYYDV